MRRAKIIFRIAAAVIIAALLFILLPLTICTDRAYICENTGSRKGYREWYFGIRTSQWYKTSAVETFMREKFPEQLQHRWTSYAGTGRNIFGTRISYGHGRPGPILQMQINWLNEWFSPLPDTEKKAFYDLLVSDDKAVIQEKMNSMLNEIIDSRSR